MVKINGYVWTVLIILGMIMLTVGAFGVFGFIVLDQEISIGLMVLGIMFIIISSIFIQIEGHMLRRKDSEFHKFEEVRDETRQVPNDLDEGYLIDYTAEPGSAVGQGSGGQEVHCSCAEAASEEDASIVYLN